MNQGACLCGAVRYEISPPYKWLAHCHCSICRKYHGTLHGTTVGVAKENFSWLQGEEAVAHYRSSEAIERSFCSHCGSKLPDMVGEDAICPAGTLEGELGMKPGAHIFVGSKSPMYEITDQLPRFEEYPPGYGQAVPTPERSHASSNPNGIHGSCLCGDVAFEIDVAPRRLVNCYCSRCRRSRGTAHATNFLAKDEHLHWTQGADRVKKYAVPGARVFSTAFCERCGSMLPAAIAPLNAHLVPAGAIDTALAIRAAANVYMDSKAPWFDVTDSLPQFAQMPPRERFHEFFG
jgi:hypothetical protein